eukprot:gene18086-24511_t
MKILPSLVCVVLALAGAGASLPGLSHTGHHLGGNTGSEAGRKLASSWRESRSTRSDHHSLITLGQEGAEVASDSADGDRKASSKVDLYVGWKLVTVGDGLTTYYSIPDHSQEAVRKLAAGGDDRISSYSNPDHSLEAGRKLAASVNPIPVSEAGQEADRKLAGHLLGSATVEPDPVTLFVASTNRLLMYQPATGFSRVLHEAGLLHYGVFPGSSDSGKLKTVWSTARPSDRSKDAIGQLDEWLIEIELATGKELQRVPIESQDTHDAVREGNSIYLAGTEKGKILELSYPNMKKVFRLDHIGQMVHGLVKWRDSFIVLSSKEGAVVKDPRKQMWYKGLAVIDDVAYFCMSPVANKRDMRTELNNNCELGALDLSSYTLLWKRTIPSAGLVNSVHASLSLKALEDQKKWKEIGSRKSGDSADAHRLTLVYMDERGGSHLTDKLRRLIDPLMEVLGQICPKHDQKIAEKYTSTRTANKLDSVEALGLEYLDPNMCVGINLEEGMAFELNSRVTYLFGCAPPGEIQLLILDVLPPARELLCR